MRDERQPKIYTNYADALADAERLAASGDVESEDFRAAVEAATLFFLAENDDDQDSIVPKSLDFRNISHDKGMRKWFTIRDLMSEKNDDDVIYSSL